MESIEKKTYDTPEIQVIELQKNPPLLAGTTFDPNSTPGYDDELL